MLSVRRQRFLKIWAKCFAIGIAIIVAGFAVASGIIIGLIKLEAAYGPDAMLIAGISGVIILVAGGFTHSLAQVKLARVEREEQEVMDALARESYQQELDQKVRAYAASAQYKPMPMAKQFKI